MVSFLNKNIDNPKISRAIKELHIRKLVISEVFIGYITYAKE